jgi:energy-coupling factor transport system permease protein
MAAVFICDCMKYFPHPSVQILIWIWLALLVQRLNITALIFVCTGVLGGALKVCPASFLGLLRRTRWVVLSLLLIYSYTTPGVALLSSLGIFSPTLEGMMDGGMQLARLLCVLAGLAILLTGLSQAQLIGGLYVLLYPLHCLGFSRERFAVRLALTLEKAEATMQETASHWRVAIAEALAPAQLGATKVEVQTQSFKWIDGVWLLACVALLIGVW